MQLPTPKEAPRRTYRSVGPFFMLSAEGDGFYTLHEFIEDAVDDFVRFCIPPSPVTGSAAVMDSYGVRVASYHYMHPENNDSQAFDWSGTEQGIHVLLEHDLVPELLAIDIEAALA